MCLMAYSDRTYVGTGPGPEWVTVYYVKPSRSTYVRTYTGPILWHCISPGPTEVLSDYGVFPLPDSDSYTDSYSDSNGYCTQFGTDISTDKVEFK